VEVDAVDHPALAEPLHQPVGGDRCLTHMRSPATRRCGSGRACRNTSWNNG
jgi:hypothetical protein